MRSSALRNWGLGLFLLAVLVVLSTLAYAQDPSTIVEVGGFWTGIAPVVTTILGTVVTAILGWLAALFQKRTGIVIEAGHRDALQTALTNAAGLAVKRFGPNIGTMKVDVRSAQLAEFVRYVQRSVPDALAYFNITPDSIAEKIEAKLGQVLPGTNQDPKANMIGRVPSDVPF